MKFGAVVFCLVLAVFAEIVDLNWVDACVTVDACGRTLAQRWDAEKKQNYPPFTFDLKTLEVIQSRHVLFIPGIMNEVSHIPLLGQYYKTSRMALREELGVESSYFGPPSWGSVTENAEIIYEEILRLHREVQKPLIILAHSKGGLELLFSILWHPLVLLSDASPNGPIVERIVFAGAALGGAHLISKWNNRLTYWLASSLLGQGLTSLEPSQVEKDLRNAAEYFSYFLQDRFGQEEEISQKKREISDRIFFIQVERATEDLSLACKMALWFCGGTSSSSVPGDGILKLEEQVLSSEIFPNFGKNLGTISSDHISPFVVGYFSLGLEEEQRAFMRALLPMLYE